MTQVSALQPIPLATHVFTSGAYNGYNGWGVWLPTYNITMFIKRRTVLISVCLG